MSRDLARIYQGIKNFLSVFQTRFDETMHGSLAICRDNFPLYLGQTLVNTMRALHSVKFNPSPDDEEADDDNA